MLVPQPATVVPAEAETPDRACPAAHSPAEHRAVVTGAFPVADTPVVHAAAVFLAVDSQEGDPLGEVNQVASLEVVAEDTGDIGKS